MAANQPPQGAPAPGLRASLDELKVQSARYLGARLALARLEAKEASGDAARRAKSGVAGFALVVFGYPLLLAGLIGLAEKLHPGTWHIAALIAAACHLLMGIPLLLAATRKDSKPWFPETLDQIKEDEKWLRTLSHRTTDNPPPKP